MNWIKVIRNAALVTLFAFVLSSVLMLFLKSRVNWTQQISTAVIFFLGSSVVLFLQERKRKKEPSDPNEI
jgi:peptidoglycan/LPS O-acetylase OafA/YrhL